MSSDVLTSLAIVGVGVAVLLVVAAFQSTPTGLDVVVAIGWLGLGWLLVVVGAIALVASLVLAALRRGDAASPRPPNR